MFTNYLNRDAYGQMVREPECAEERTGRWFIKLGFAGFNSRANNLNGYATKAKAEAACRKYQTR